MSGSRSAGLARWIGPSADKAPLPPHSSQRFPLTAFDLGYDPLGTRRPSPRPGSRRRTAPVGRASAITRTRAAVVITSLSLGLVTTVLIALTSRTPATVVLWGGGFLVLLLTLGGTQIRRGIGGAFRPPVMAGTVTAALGFALLGVQPPSETVGFADIPSLVNGLILLVLVIGFARSAIAMLLKPRVALVVDESGPRDSAQAASPTVVVALGADLRQDPAAVAAAVVPVVEDNDITHVEIGFEIDPQAATELSWRLRRRRVPVALRLGTTALSAGRAHVISHPGRPALVVEPPEPSLAVRGAKRAFDIVVAAALVLVLSPVMIAVALAIVITMPGPVLFFQERIGKDGVPFRIMKFRSMIVDADAALARLLADQQTDGTPLFKVANDPRITRLGAFLRRYSLDELPQLFNVLGGSMSLVGPRPQRAEEVALYTGTADHRLGVLPGMTGLWQVSGRSDLSWEQAQELDVYYAHNWSLGFDLVILCRTFNAVVRAAGAV